MDEREHRLARNEALFREINERVRELAATHGSDEHVYEFFCECSNGDCTFQVSLTLADYERVRARGDHFLVLPGHDLPEIERIVERNEGWLIVEKQGKPAELVEELDPRS